MAREACITSFTKLSDNTGTGLISGFWYYMVRDKLSDFMWYKILVILFLFFFSRSLHEPRAWRLSATQRVRREVTAVARRQTYKIFGVGHNSFQDTRHVQEVTGCSSAAGQTICLPRWAHRVCWAHAHLEAYHHQHPQEFARPRSCQSLFDCLRETMESTGRHGQHSLVESIWIYLLLLLETVV